MEQSAKSTELPAKSFTRKFIFMRIKLIFLMFCTRNCFETEAQKKLGIGLFIPTQVVSAGILVLIAKMFDSFWNNC